MRKGRVIGKGFAGNEVYYQGIPGVKALDNVNITVMEGEIHALVGENGAGKTTLMNVLSGIHPYGTYSGEIVFDGRICQHQGIKDSERLGIVIIHQELALILIYLSARICFSVMNNTGEA